MAQLIPASEAFEQASVVRQAQFAELLTKVPFVIEQLNERITTAMEKGVLFIELSLEEIETVPDTKPEVFVAFLQDKGYTLTSPVKGKYLLYFHNPFKD